MLLIAWSDAVYVLTVKEYGFARIPLLLDDILICMMRNLTPALISATDSRDLGPQRPDANWQRVV